MRVLKRVLLCCEQYAPSIGGVQEVMRQIAERLAAAGLDVTVATSAYPGRPQNELRNGVRVLSFPVSGNDVTTIKGDVLAYHELLINGNFDAILIKAAQQWTFDAAIAVLPTISARKFFIPCGFSSLNNPNYAIYYSEMPRRLKLFDGLIFYSGQYQDIVFAKEHGIKNLHLLPNGVDEREFLNLDSHSIRAVLGISEGEKLFLSVGSLLSAKGHWEVLRAFMRTRLGGPATLVINGHNPGNFWERRRRDIKHLLEGRWPLMLEARYQMLRHFRQGKKIRVLDLPRNQLLDLYKSANLFVFASHVEYSPLVLFEAVAAGTPFLATSAGNSAEIAAWTGAGDVLLESNVDARIKEFSSSMERLASDLDVLASRGLIGRRNIMEGGYTWSCIVKRYREILSGHVQPNDFSEN